MKAKILRKKIKEHRQKHKRPITANELVAIENACNQWHNKLDGLMIKFILYCGTRGKNTMSLSKQDIEKDKIGYFLKTPHKDRMVRVDLTDDAVEIYKEILQTHKEMHIISNYLFPSFDYTGGTFAPALRSRHCNGQDKRRAWCGTKGTGGIRSLASKEAPTLLGVKYQTAKQQIEFGEWKIKPCGVHKIRAMYGTEAETSEQATLMLQNKVQGTALVDGSYREEKPEHTKRIANQKQTLINRLRVEGSK